MLEVLDKAISITKEDSRLVLLEGIDRSKEFDNDMEMIGGIIEKEDFMQRFTNLAVYSFQRYRRTNTFNGILQGKFPRILQAMYKM